MMLYHATLKANLDSINAKGIDPEFSQGKESVIWLHTAGRREWAILHTQKRHNCALDDIDSYHGEDTPRVDTQTQNRLMDFKPDYHTLQHNRRGRTCRVTL